jgi:hypothetical protein
VPLAASIEGDYFIRRMPPRHKWALAIATLIPIAAIVFAFSLGPSHEKALLGQLPHKDMPHRREAIQFLAEGRHRAAIPVLEMIARDESEAAPLRADALRAIHMIDPNRDKEPGSDL